MNRRRLLILACSAKKKTAAGELAARDRYDGPLWQTLRAADPSASRAAVAVVSAAYGFRTAGALLPYYDHRLTRASAAAMIAGGIFAPWPDRDGARPVDAIAELAARAGGDFDDVAIVGGALYVAVMRAAVAGFRDSGFIADAAPVCEIRDTIGRMRRRLRAWLEAAPANALVAAAQPVDGELIVDESGYGFMPPEFVRGAGNTWLSMRALGVPLPIDVTPRRTSRPRRSRRRRAAAIATER